MTDHQRALLAVNTIITVFLVVTAIPLTVKFGLVGLVASYFLMLSLNNAMEIVVLYYLEGLQPFTLLHAKPIAAAVPFALIALATKLIIGEPIGPALGTLFGLGAYAMSLRYLGFSAIEWELASTLANRYKDQYQSISTTLSSTGLLR